MAYCVKCGASVDDTSAFCPHCGERIPPQGSSQGYQQQYQQQGNAEEYTYQQQGNAEGHAYQQEEYFDAYDVKKNKGMGVVSYLGILVLIPLLAGDKNSPYVRHHANQGLMLFIISTIVDLFDGKWIGGFHSWMNFGGSVLSWIFDIADLACFILLIVGIVTACKGEKKELPIIGKYKFLK